MQYDSYKDSGEQWLGQIPSHWEMAPAKRYFHSHKNIVGKEYVNYERISLTMQGVLKRDKNDSQGLQPEDFGTYQIVYSNDLIFKLIDLANFATSRVGLSPYEGIVSPAYILLSSNGEINLRYAEYFYLNMWYRHIFNGLGDAGVRSSLSVKDLLRTPILIPFATEQERMVVYLDKETAAIDAAIAQQQRMIDLLNERKQIIIQQAVTKGLDPNAKMKDSGIDWIGQIPEHWKLMQYRHLFNNLDYLRSPITADQRERNNPQYDYYGASGVIDKIDHYNIDDEVLLIGEDGANLLMRNLPLIYKAKGKFWVNNHAHILKPKNDLYDYMAHVMEAADYTLAITGSAQPKLSQTNLNSIKLPIPPIEEQQKILQYLEQQIEPIGMSLDRANNIISLLRERKQILINEVVTGKIKV